MSKHTPGPWEICVTDAEGVLIQTKEKILVADNGERFHKLIDITGDRSYTPSADDRLIAAAPELLEAAKNLIRWADDFNGMFPVNVGADVEDSRKMLEKALDQANAAVAKAEGRE